MSVVLHLHYFVAFFSLIGNILLIGIIVTRTTTSFRNYAILIFQECIFELVSATANILSMQRLIPIPGTTIFASLGVCSNVSASFCYFFHTMTVCCYVCTVFITSFQLVFRSQMLHQTTSPLIEFWIFPVAILCILLHVNVWCHQTETFVLEKIVNKVFPEFIKQKLPINGHDSLSIHVLSVNALYAIIVPGVFIFMFFRRRNVLKALARIRSKLSPKSKQLQEGLIKSITVHAILSTSGIWPGFIFLSGQFVIIHEENFLDSCFFFLQLQSAIVPLVTIYYVPNYRRFFRRGHMTSDLSSIGNIRELTVSRQFP